MQVKKTVNIFMFILLLLDENTPMKRAKLVPGTGEMSQMNSDNKTDKITDAVTGKTSGISSEKKSEEITSENTSMNSHSDLFEFKPICYAKSVFKTKAGTPRQPNLTPSAPLILDMSKCDSLNNPAFSIDGLAEFSHAWVIFVFHKNNTATVNLTFREMNSYIYWSNNANNVIIK